MKTLRLLLVDQLSESISSLQDVNMELDFIMIAEVMEEATYVPHHVKKLAFQFSAMRHFAEELKQQGYNVIYVKLDDKDNTGSLDMEIIRVSNLLKPDKIIVTFPGEYRLLEKIKTWQDTTGIEVEVRPDTRFLCSIEEFKKWVGNKKQLRMEFFYREMRKKHQILIDKDLNPVGNKWNYDAENRNPPKQGIKSPKRISHKKDQITLEVLRLVKERFSNRSYNFGDLDTFYFAVNRKQALQEAKHFIDKVLPLFGHYQDTMVMNEPYLYHSLLSCYINIGLLLPLELCKMAEKAYYEGKVPLNSAEGFIRQILGWREYIRGIYWNFMPEYAERNFFNVSRPLPASYWGGPTKMQCISEVVKHTKEHAYSHHIQRLMVTGNFALITGLDPKEVCEWYLAVYADAYDWVELPNTLGMSLYGDGGIIASKPYASSGKYINRMSNFCKGCYYDPEVTIGENACPYNAFYWNFISSNDTLLKNNNRMQFVYKIWDRFAPKKKQAIIDHVNILFEKLDNNLL